MTQSQSMFTEGMHRRGELDAIMEREDRNYRELRDRVDHNGGMTPDELDQAMADYHRVFHGEVTAFTSYMGTTIVSRSVETVSTDLV